MMVKEYVGIITLLNEKLNFSITFFVDFISLIF